MHRTAQPPPPDPFSSPHDVAHHGVVLEVLVAHGQRQPVIGGERGRTHYGTHGVHGAGVVVAGLAADNVDDAGAVVGVEAIPVHRRIIHQPVQRDCGAEVMRPRGDGRRLARLGADVAR